MTRLTTIPLILLLLLLQCTQMEASMLRAQTKDDESSRNLLTLVALGCPAKECHPISYFGDAEETAVECDGDCDYGLPCVFHQGTFQCANHVVGVDPCSLECVSKAASSAGASPYSIQVGNPPSTTPAPTPAPTPCPDVKTCLSVNDLINAHPSLSAANSACNSTDDCPLGECRFYSSTSTKEFRCDDELGTLCGFPCVEDESSSRGNIVSFNNAD